MGSDLSAESLHYPMENLEWWGKLISYPKRRRPGMKKVRVIGLSITILMMIVTSYPLVGGSNGVTLPPGILVYASITITNSQNVATPSSFQQMITLDSSMLSNYEASNLQNVEFFYSNGEIISSWLESGNSNTATNTVYWLKLPNGIPSSSSITIYVGFASSTTNLFDGRMVGEAPNLSTNYGQYDNGATIFNFYDNFNGTSLSTSWTSYVPSGGSLSVNNGLTITGSSGTFCGYGVDTELDSSVAGAQFNGPSALDVYFQVGSGPSNFRFGFRDTGLCDLQDGFAGHGYSVDYQFPANPQMTATNGGDGLYNGACNTIAPGWTCQFGNGSDNNPDVFSIGASSSFATYVQNYIQTTALTITTNTVSYSSSIGIGLEENYQTTPIHVTWVRTRILPPNGVMPPAKLSTVFTGSTTGVLGTVNLGGSPIGVAYNPANGEIYVSNQNLNTVSVINGTTHNVVTTISVGSTPIGLAYNPVNNAIYVANAGSGTVSIINSDNTLSPTTISAGAYPEGVAYDSANGNLYVANRDSNTITVINATDNTIVTTVNDSGGLKGVAFDPLNGYMYFVGIGGVVSVLASTNNTIIQTLTLASGPFSSPFGIAFDPANGNIYVVDDRTSALYIINGQTNQLTSTAPMSTGPLGLAYDPTTNDFFVTNRNGVLTILDASTNSIHSQITISNGDGWGVVVDPATGEIYTANTNAGTVSIIKIVQSTSSSTLHGGSVFVNQTSTTGVSVSIIGSGSPDGTMVSVTSVVLGNAQPDGTGALPVEALNFYDVQVSGTTSGLANVCITNPSVSAPTIIQYWTGTVWANATNVGVANNTVCGNIPVANLKGTPVAIGDVFHAKLVDETRALIVNERLVTSPTQTLVAGVKNDGLGGKLAVTVTSYVSFTIVGSKGFNAVYYTQVVTLQGGARIAGKTDPRLQVSFQPSSTPQVYTVTARVFYSPTQSMTIGDPSFTSIGPDNVRTFQFMTR